MAAASAATARNLLQSVNRKFGSDPILQRLAHKLSDWLRRAAIGHPDTVDKRNEIASPALKQRDLPYHGDRIVHHGKFGVTMSALGQKQTS
jgi:hypothetical protein